VISRKMGRVLSAVGALMLVAGLFLTWYHIDRSQGATETTGWQTFTRLRVGILGGAVLLLLSALVRQVRAVLVARTALGVVLGALIMRRIIDPPDLVFDVSAQLGVAVGLVGAIAAALGGLVDSGREVVERYPDLAGLRRAPGGLLESGGDGQHATLLEPPPPRRNGTQRPYIDSTADEVQT
jgi:peptidoglycan/LPS O-acetylase OafA/YrhL